MVEFALCFPVLLLLVISLIDYGQCLETENNLASVVRDGTRYASIDPTAYGCTGGATANSCAANTVQGVLQAEATSLRSTSGGETLANYNCVWSGVTTPPVVAASQPLPAAPTNASGSCMTIAFYSSEATGTAACAYYQTSTSALASGATCTVTNSTTPLFVEVTVAVTATAADPVMVTMSQLQVAPLLSRHYTMEVVP